MTIFSAYANCQVCICAEIIGNYCLDLFFLSLERFSVLSQASSPIKSIRFKCKKIIKIVKVDVGQLPVSGHYSHEVKCGALEANNRKALQPV